ncbi:MAG: AAA family ATPase, partial [Propionibacteriaceae bacterium]|nr:AAA family ATPase [Propionibacteriaceae bacterium]
MNSETNPANILTIGRAKDSTTSIVSESAFERILNVLYANGCTVKQGGSGTETVATCPAHDDKNPSLSVGYNNGRVLLYCHAGCHIDAILGALGLAFSDLFDEPNGALNIFYDYRDSSGEYVKTKIRKPGKKFIQTGDTKRALLYRLPEVITAVQAEQMIFLVEGEKDVETLLALGVCATTSGSATSIPKCDLSPLHDAQVIAVVDRDPAGDSWAQDVYRALHGKSRSLEFKQAVSGKDVSDHIAAGYLIGQLAEYEKVDDLISDIGRTRWQNISESPPPQSIDWLAVNWLPASTVSVLVGEEGIGKSLWWIWLVAALTRGAEVKPLGIPAGRCRTVAVVLTEDDQLRVVKPRLLAAGADIKKIFWLTSGENEPPIDVDLAPTMLKDLTPKPDLVIVDAWLDTVAPGLRLQQPRDARLALDPWKSASSCLGAASLLVAHTNRLGSDNARDNYGASAQLRTTARTTLYMLREELGAVVIGVDKSNYGIQPNAQRYRIESTCIEEIDQPVPRMVWVEDTGKKINELVHEYAQQNREKARDENPIDIWLRSYLETHGTVLRSEVMLKGKDEGYSESAIKRAFMRLGAKYDYVKESGKPPVTMWSLP